ncbi:MAG: acyloxyacyl hydrolase [Bacteroidia bacterium]
MRPLLVHIIVMIAIVGMAHAQGDSLHTWHVRANVHRGVVLPEYGSIDYLVNDFVHGAELSIVRQTRGKSIWEQLYKYPSFGLRLFYSGLGNAAVFGHQLAVSPYFVCRLVEAGPFSLDGEMGLGLSYATKTYDIRNNPRNILIGSHLNIHYHAELMARLRFGRRFMWHAGIAFNHISNANLAQPNVGINSGTLNTGFWYALGKVQPVLRQEIPEWKPRFVLEGRLSAGVKHTRTFESLKYAAAAVCVDGKYRWSHKFAAGIGGDFFYDASVRPLMQRSGKDFLPQYAFMSGLHCTAEAYFGKASFALQHGFYLGLRPHLNSDWYYNRFVINYHFTDHIFASLSFKSRLVILDYQELGLGFRL